MKRKIKWLKERYPKDWKLPNIYLLHGSLPVKELNYLYNHPKVKAFVSFTHGEGFGRPLLEASMVGLPILTSGWSGQMDFLKPDYSLLLPGEMEKVPESQYWENIIIPESKWFYVNKDSAYRGFNILFADYNSHKSRAKELMNINRKKFTLNHMTQDLDDIMEKHLINQPKQVSLKLPKLKKVKEKV